MMNYIQEVQKAMGNLGGSMMQGPPQGGPAGPPDMDKMVIDSMMDGYD